MFQYVDKDGSHHSVDSADVNDYLREITNQDFTAKDFRTWAGSVLACEMLRELGAFESEPEAKRNVIQAIKQVSSRLGNTPSVCRKCYVHPLVVEYYMNGTILDDIKRRVQGNGFVSHDSLRIEELALLELLRRQVGLAKRLNSYAWVK